MEINKPVKSVIKKGGDKIVPVSSVSISRTPFEQKIENLKSVATERSRAYLSTFDLPENAVLSRIMGDTAQVWIPDGEKKGIHYFDVNDLEQ